MSTKAIACIRFASLGRQWYYLQRQGSYLAPIKLLRFLEAYYISSRTEIYAVTCHIQCKAKETKTNCSLLAPLVAIICVKEARETHDRRTEYLGMLRPLTR
jgi:hypothetical protein